MPRIRSIKPEFFRSRTLAECSPRARLTFVGLWTLADDEGRYQYEPELLKADLWPWEPDIGPKETEACIAELESRGRICVYQHAGKTYLHVVNWNEHQKISHKSESRLPACHRETHGDPPEDSGGFRSTPEDSGGLQESSGVLPPDLGSRKGIRDLGKINTVVEQARPLAVIPGGFSDDPADILDVWEAWKTSTGKKRADFSAARRTAIVKALDRYPVADVLDAVRGHANDPWPERPQHNDITQLLHMGTARKPHNTLEKMRDLWRDGPPRQVSKTTAQAMRTSVAMRARRHARAQAEEVNYGPDRGRLDRSGGSAQRELPAPAD